ncbi:hypothetical protein MGYG_02914 [Nannizzia gypsea CBS 118893]|uniref:Uncharacterized protein n=1 Tax=Arthroderma gypseum (strain ATCC MYA-4604 / CBS 118893) TaxID=535722 RepID=E4UPT4_ARTGP|nr:hypothetical protein MGYG_02914 [Nannizzia gypsea CBS 118893]EFQ99906.1 hypothetical protein MGYG_02914 [Nannizzia gypsea CBS 118893]
MPVGLWSPPSPKTRTTTRILSNPSEQWKLSLQEVKLLHLRCRYKQCAARSMEVLSKFENQLHKVHEAYFQYYIAASYENLGRASHSFSGNKIPLLQIAMDSFIACKSSLENAFTDPARAEETEPFPEFNEAVGRYPECGAYVATHGYIFYQSARENSRPPALFQVRCCDESNSTGSQSRTKKGGRQCIDVKADLIPQPLQIRKNRKDTMPQYNQSHKMPFATTAARPLPEPPISISVNPASAAINGTAAFTPPPTPKFIDCFPDELAIKEKPTPRMMSLIASLSSQIDENVRELSQFINKTMELQRVHKTRKMNRLASYWSFTPTYPNGPSTIHGNTESYDAQNELRANEQARGQSTLTEGKQQRIARLKAEGWNTVGIKSVERGWKGTLHYDRLCSEALSELYEP